nr:uncharacterized protein LOC129439886 [Misgurnus anguillicaudatus]
MSPEICAVDMKIKWFKETDCVCIYEKREVTEARDYMNKVSLFTEEIIKGNVSLRIQRFTESDLGDYVCQVTSENKTEEITVRVIDTTHTSDSKQEEKQITEKEEPKDTNAIWRIAAGALVGTVCAPIAAVALTGAAAVGAVGTIGLAVGAAVGAVEAVAAGTTREGAEGREGAEAVDHKKITFLKIDRRWSEQERQEMERSSLLTELHNNSEQLDDTKRCLEEKENKIKDLEMDRSILVKEKDELQKTIQWKDKIIEEKDKRLQETNEKLSQTTRELEEKHNFIMEKNTQLENMKKIISDNERQLKETKKEMETRKNKLDTLRTELQTHFRQLQEELQTLKQEPSSHTAVRRRNSKDKIEPTMSGETASVLVSGSELRLVLLGSAGSEKSASVNIILNREEKIQTDTSTEIQQSESRQGEVNGKQVTVVETPDWFCSGLSLEEVRPDVGLCVRLSAPGPHAFLLVIPVQQSTGVERAMLEKMEEIFGERCWRNTIILFTVTDKEQEKNIEDFVQSGNQEVQRLVEKCGNRFHCLNIHQSGDDSQISELLEKIEKMVEGNTEKFYSSKIYQTERLLIEREKFSTVQKILHKLKDIVGSIEGCTELEELLT